MNYLQTWREQLAAYPMAETLVGLALLALGALAASFLARSVLVRIAEKLFAKTVKSGPTGLRRHVFGRLSNIIPAIVIHHGIGFVPGVAPFVVALVQTVAAAIIILVVTRALTGALGVVNALYQRRPEARSRPIKGYLQVVSILLYLAATVLIVAVILDESPLLLLSGLGAIAAVLMLVFKDTILSLVASVQLASDDMLRVGDWIDMPSSGANGDVIDIALHTVKVQNWDKTVVTVPTYRLISESFRNYRTMYEFGGRRIMRSLRIDAASVRFLREDEHRALGRLTLLHDYLDGKTGEIDAWNANLGTAAHVPANTRRLTNLGTFRAYVTAYLKAHPRIAQDKTLLVRQLQSDAQGVPIEIYGFANSTAWADYENAQGDIFDHLIAVLPEFGLRLFQEPTGADLARFAASTKPEAA